jgi:hypothetical protein
MLAPAVELALEWNPTCGRNGAIDQREISFDVRSFDGKIGRGHQ